MSTRLRQLSPLVATLCILACDIPALAQPPQEAAELVPAESLLTWVGQPLPDADFATQSTSTLRALLELGRHFAGDALDAEAKLYARIGELLGLMVQHPHALVLIDTQAKPADTDPTAKRVDHLCAALVLETDGQNDAIYRLIQKTVNEQAHKDSATLTERRAHGWTYQALQVHELPAWTTISWGQIGDFFILTVGKGVWETVADVAAGERASIAATPWFAAARRPRYETALIEIFVRAADIRTRLDPVLDGRAGEFFDAWDAGGLRKAHWSLGLEGRALFCLAHFQVHDETARRLYADPHANDPRWLSTVPAEARYAIYELPLQRFLQRFFRGLLTIRGEKQQRIINRIWAEIERERGLDAEQDLLRNLGTHIILHNYPRHPLRVPLAVTGLIEIRQKPDDVRRTLDGICDAFRDALVQAAEEGRGPPPWTLRRDDDGVWYLQFALLAGPAWTVTDRFIVFSWSPTALRQYLAQQPAAPTATPVR